MKHEFKKLRIWQDARQLNKEIYEITKLLPSEEKFGLTSQIRRASVSVASNIAEGSGYQSNPMFIKYLNTSLGSLCEVETQLYLATDVGFLATERIENLTNSIEYLKRMILKFRDKLSKD